MILYLYKLGTNTPALTIKNARSYTAASAGQLHTGIITATVIEMNPTEELMTEPAVPAPNLLFTVPAFPPNQPNYVFLR